jgi:hypothetical protein
MTVKDPGVTRRIVYTLLGLLITHATTSSAAVLYVQPSGSNSNPCTQSQPCQTIAHGISRLAGGDTLMVGAGDYDEALDGAIPSGLSASQPTTIRNVPGERVVIKPVTARNGNNITLNADGDYLVIDGIHIDAVFNLGFGLGVGGTGNVYRNFSITRAYGQAVSGLPDHGTFCNIEIYNVGQYDRPGNPYYPYRGYHHGMYLGGEGNMGGDYGIVLDGVYIHDVQDGSGIQLYAGGVRVRNSRIERVPYGNGIYLLGQNSSVSNTSITNVGGEPIAGPGGRPLSQVEGSGSAASACEGSGPGPLPPPKRRLPAPTKLQVLALP